MTFQCLCQNFGLFFFNDTATTEIYTRKIVGSVQMCIRDSPYGTTKERRHFQCLENGASNSSSSFPTKNLSASKARLPRPSSTKATSFGNPLWKKTSS